MSETVVLFTLIPLVTAFIGYVTKWAAVKMIFHPAEPRLSARSGGRGSRTRWHRSSPVRSR